MERFALDTTFLIDLQNEHRARGKPRGAIEFLRAHPTAELLLPSVALGEYLEGFDDPGGPEARALVLPLDVIAVDAGVACLYAQITRSLRASHRLIGANDLWIGCTARVAEVPLVTRDVDHFSRIPDLEVIGYRPAH